MFEKNYLETIWTISNGRTTILFQAFIVEGNAWLAYILMAINLIGKDISLMQPIAVDWMENGKEQKPTPTEEYVKFVNELVKDKGIVRTNPHRK